MGFWWSLMTALAVLGAHVESGCDRKDENCKKKMKKELLIPTYFDKVKTTELSIQWAQTTVDCGNSATLLEALKPPKVSYKGVAKCENLTLLFFDPDVLAVNPLLHWLVYDIPADVLAKTGYTSGKIGNEMREYVPPLFPRDNHRYTFCLYCQNEETDTSKNPERPKFDPKAFASDQHLGDPVACNFVYLQSVHLPKVQPVDNMNKDLTNSDKNPVSNTLKKTTG